MIYIIPRESKTFKIVFLIRKHNITVIQHTERSRIKRHFYPLGVNKTEFYLFARGIPHAQRSTCTVIFRLRPDNAAESICKTIRLCKFRLTRSYNNDIQIGILTAGAARIGADDQRAIDLIVIFGISLKLFQKYGKLFHIHI